MYTYIYSCIHFISSGYHVFARSNPQRVSAARVPTCASVYSYMYIYIR